LNSAGGIIIQVSDRILLSGMYQDEETGEIRPAGLFATSQNGQGGLLTLSAPEIIIRDGAQANASTASGVGGVVSIDGDTLTIRSRSDTPTDTGIFASAMTGTGGDIVIGNLEAFESIRLLGPRSQIAAQATELDGNSGSVTMTVRDLTLQDGAQLTTENESGLTVLTDENSDDPPGISLLGLDQLLLTTGGRVSSQTQTGEAGVIEIEAPNGRVVLRDPGTEISARANDEGGTAGNVSITAQTAILRNQAQVTASNISGRSGDVRFTGLDSLHVLDGASITASTEVGIAGNLSVNEGDRPVDQILVSRGSRLAVEATGLDDDAPTDNALSLSLLAAAETDSKEAIATAGNLTLNTRQLTVESGSELTVRSLLGRAGNLTVNTNALTLNNGDLSASTAADGENGANIFLNFGQGSFLAGRNRIEGSLFLQNESLVEANASRGATGGNITISAPDGYIISTLPSGDSGSDITANADVGNGGSIRIDALGLLGIAFRNQLTPFNDITAISLDGGLPGFVDINTLGIDPSRGLADLPDVVATAPPLDAVCGEGTGFGASRFVTAGRGGLPTDPGDVLPGGVTSSSWVTRGLGVSASLLEEDATVDEASVQGSDPAIGLTEAQGWSVSPGGSVTLASVTQTAIPIPSAQPGHHLCGRSPTPPN
jgi:large exoprotein involved in heme utilization and adhesion